MVDNKRNHRDRVFSFHLLLAGGLMRLNNWWENVHQGRLAGFFFLALGILGFIDGPVPSFSPDLTDFYYEISPEFIGIGLTVLAIDWANDRRASRELKKRLIREMASTDNGIARRAWRELRAQKRGLNGDVSLFGADLRGANLAGVDLRGANLAGALLNTANLAGAVLEGAHLAGADLRGANLEEAGVEDDQLKQVRGLWRAIMPDGSWYDGRFNLYGDIWTASFLRVDVDDPDEMARWYAGEWKPEEDTDDEEDDD